MDALKHLIANIPDWLKRLEELNNQIEKRQAQLALIAEQTRAKSGGTTAPRSIRNKGSTESLKPKGEPEAHPNREATPPPEDGVGTKPAAEQPPPASPAESQSPSAIQRMTMQARAAGQARARQTLRRRQRSDSVVSAEGAAPKFRTRSMIIVYYDSYVQLFFEDLVKFVSNSRNMMRKAKMAAKVAQIKRLAELEMHDESDEETSDSANPDGNAPIEANNVEPEEQLPSLRYMTTRRMQSPGMLMAQAALGRSMYSRTARGGFGRGGGLTGLEPMKPDIYDDLDKGLEYVQSMCEHAAHQFLRDGDCAEEVGNIERRLGDTKELADREMERIQREDPESLNKPAEDEMRVRSYRPPSMRKDIGSPSTRSETNLKEGAASSQKEATRESVSPSNELEVDEGVEDMDTEVVPKLAYKSTRMMT
ncbi:hypothetical protein QBC47DRAFT_197593 [Echria macrotheca]|uniref:Uncharacterized protein n=1 Tax=Echria macrotheca TaxID=438768 RepID=A0AAJ0FBW7_9PEZI|nr:hypothetical protein QBC47DRAFT_197593 [Echria macrotheca]